MKSKGLIELENKWADRLNIIDYTSQNFSFNSENPNTHSYVILQNRALRIIVNAIVSEHHVKAFYTV